MKTLFKENPKIIILIIVGILLSSLSFVFETFSSFVIRPLIRYNLNFS